MAMGPRYNDVKVCELCGVLCMPSAMYEAHIAGERHRRKLAGSDVVYHCSVCDIYISKGVWDQHISGRPHTRRANEQGVSADIAPIIPDALPGLIFCSVCDKHIPERLWSSHSTILGHRKKEAYVAYKAATGEAEKDKHGVTVSDNMEFGIIEPAVASRGASKSLTIQTTIPSSRITIVSAKFSSSTTNSPSPFELQRGIQGLLLAYGRTMTVDVFFRHPHIGRLEDRLEILFEDISLKQQFVIVRPVSAIVGSRSDYELLKPRAPFVPRRTTARRPENNVIPGIKPPSINAIPYVVKLPKAKIPDDLMAALSDQSDMHVVGQIKRVFLPQDLNEDTYARHFKALLWIEEFRMERDLEHYDILDATLRDQPSFDIGGPPGRLAMRTRDPNYYIAVPGLAEKRPSVLVGDRILVQKVGGIEGKWYEGGVHVVQQAQVGLRFHASFTGWSPSQRYIVRFKLNRIPIQRQHQALDTTFMARRVLFPAPNDVQLGPAVVIRPFNRLLETNYPQRLAVTCILRQQPGSPPFVIFGPPGTGKTVTIVESIKQILHHNPNARILATAPSNSAADIIAERLISGLNTDELFRLYAPSRFKNQVPDQLQPYTFMREPHFSTPPITIFKRFKVVVCTCVSASIPYGIGVPRGHFSHIFVDEAGQATEPEVMISIKTLADTRTNIVLSGDPKQLGPIIRSGIARKLGLETSYLERLMNSPMYDAIGGHRRTVVKLIKNFRSHPAILNFPNNKFYAGDLEACGDKHVIDAYIGYPKLPSGNFPIIFHAVKGKDDREATSPSFFNVDEITQVKEYIKALRNEHRFRTTDGDIGVITPYHAQCLKLRKAVADDIKVGSVEEFQGQERKVIIISTVRSSRDFVEYDLKHTLGFVANPRRFNVAVTRAQALLIVIGDPSALSLDPLWRSFLNYVYENRGWAGLPPTWDTSAPVDENGSFGNGVQEAALLDMNSFSRRMERLTLSGVQGEYDDEVGESDANVDREWREVE